MQNLNRRETEVTEILTSPFGLPPLFPPVQIPRSTGYAGALRFSLPSNALENISNEAMEFAVPRWENRLTISVLMTPTSENIRRRLLW
jgi:hypothetical protein